MIKSYGFTFQQWKFPGGEIGVKIEGNHSQLATIDWFVEPANMHEEFFVVANLADAIKRLSPVCYLQLQISYLPYARQDRVCHTGESYSRFVFEGMLQSLPYDSLILRDPHSKSELTEDFRTNVWAQESLASRMINPSGYDLLIAPDKGAEEKTKVLSEQTGIRYICMEKERVDGKVIHKPLKPQMLRVNRALVIDDICDGGATFISVAEAVRQYNSKHFDDIDLWVSHGIFSKGLTELQKHYNKISCYNLMNPDLVDQVPFVISPFKKEV